jgi:hypothetical protein
MILVVENPAVSTNFAGQPVLLADFRPGGGSLLRADYQPAPLPKVGLPEGQLMLHPINRTDKGVTLSHELSLRRGCGTWPGVSGARAGI